MPLSISTQRQRLGTVKDYFKWLTKHNHILANPASELELPKKQKRLPEQALSLSQVQGILHVPDVSTLLGMRNRTILEIFYSTGMRRAELTNLSISDINQERHIVFIRQGKGSKDRVVPIGKTALYWLNQYLDKARDKLALHHEETTLFLSGYGQPITAQAMTSLISRIIKQADIGRTGSCHLLRHSCATHMLEGGADIRFIQQLLGHESLDTTAIYTQVSIEQLKAVHARCHPLEAKQAKKKKK